MSDQKLEYAILTYAVEISAPVFFPPSGEKISYRRRGVSEAVVALNHLSNDGWEVTSCTENSNILLWTLRRLSKIQASQSLPNWIKIETTEARAKF
ncbi:MAG: hypothetical protein JEZ00_20015 [Anaerolineaceae bacterium]|nr:hypothetical protein [Anaerolineaceae bacterium]